MTHAPHRTAAPLTTRPIGDAPARVAGLLVLAWAEVQAGRRPLRQLDPLLSPAIRRRLAVQAPPRRPPSEQAIALRRIVVRHPTPDACEAVVLVERDRRVTAVAVRLERHLGRWRAVDLTAPEAGLTALPTASLPPGYRPRDAFDEVEEEFTEARG
ncbi:MAG: Rv3235 family protein [Nitriliruptoraceae bacterium]